MRSDMWNNGALYKLLLQTVGCGVYITGLVRVKAYLPVLLLTHVCMGHILSAKS